MANVYDDEKQKVSDDDLRHITGVSIGEEDQWEAAARDSLANREQAAVTDSQSGAEDDGLTERQRLKNQEEKPKIGTPPDVASKMSPEQTKQFDSALGLHTPGGRRGLQALTYFERHKKAIIGGGVGGTLVMTFLVSTFFIFPTFRIPSAMSLINNIVGEAAEEIVENRAQRIVIGYLIQKAGGTPGNYVITDSLLGSLWATFQTNRLEEKIFKQTGFRLEKGEGDRIRVTHDGRDLGEVSCAGFFTSTSGKDCVDRVARLMESTPRSQKDVRKMVRLSVPAWKFIKASKMARYIRIKYGIPRYGTPERDKTKTPQENLEMFRKSQIGPVMNNTINRVGSVFGCLLEDKDCESLDRNNNQPIDTTGKGILPDDVENISKSSEQVTNTLREAASETADEVAKTGASFTTTLTQKLLASLIGTAGAAAALKTIPIIGWIDLAATIEHAGNKFVAEGYATRVPSLMIALATSTMYAQWQGYADQSAALRMDWLFLGALTKQLSGSGETSALRSCAYKFATGKTPDPATCVPVESRVNNNVTNPIYEHINEFVRVKQWVDPLEWWYDTIGAGLRAVSSFFSWLANPLTSFLVERFLSLINEEFFYEWMQSTVLFILRVAAASVDPLATGFRLWNQIYTGGDAAHQDYTAINLGGRATSAVHEVGPGAPSQSAQHSVYTAYSGPTLDDRLDLAALPLGDRLFSLEEPYSLLNTVVRATPTNIDPAGWVASTINKIASLPSNLFAIFTNRTQASHATPEEKAAIAGVRQYGATAQDLDQDIAAEVRLQTETTCPENNPEEYFNVCQADKEVIGGLMCIYTDCPEFTTGGLDRPGETNGLIAGLKQLWYGGRSAVSAGVWQ